jgi:hypothetical protein
MFSYSHLGDYEIHIEDRSGALHIFQAVETEAEAKMFCDKMNAVVRAFSNTGPYTLIILAPEPVFVMKTGPEFVMGLKDFVFDSFRTRGMNIYIDNPRLKQFERQYDNTSN